MPPLYGPTPCALVVKALVAEDDVLTSPKACCLVFEPLSV
jgi:hypothetical protein